MVKLLRVDHRLLHGQVAFSWTGYLGADCILIANDEAVINDLKRTTLRLAKPASCKLVIKSIEDSINALNNGKTDKYNLFIVVDKVVDAYRLAKSVDRIKTVNIGGLKATDKTHPHPANNNINFSDEDEQELTELKNMGKSIELRMVPNDPVKYF
ncbi:PTS sugar transporter subunit IIB [Maledivibacter halophilus]|uniref:PTS system, mannose-specific IIB component n=1 Tax=Maledivibacter halophilus TaxID=36842 RepID=A0A1T5M8D5_9FIRM|nr:PTS sugar transporter subunit IIB [Maledivibacter halophilus]SKC84512.1 PTS system, mannose-specific IIB component [Maledivibacter halophilus]